MAMATNNMQNYEEIEYTETQNETKQTENIDESTDPQTTERNLGGIIKAESATQQHLNPAKKCTEHAYDGLNVETGEDGDTERRHFTSVPPISSF